MAQTRGQARLFFVPRGHDATSDIVLVARDAAVCPV